MKKYLITLVILILSNSALFAGSLLWPADCMPGDTCTIDIGYPDIDEDGKVFDCKKTGNKGHKGTDIKISWGQFNAGVEVYASADGKVLWVFDGKFDHCPSNNRDCQSPPHGWAVPANSNGYRRCTDWGPFCNEGRGRCFWCFDGGNVIVIRHYTVPGVFATRYDHVKKGSILVTPGMHVKRGQKIAEIGSAGNSTGPHLHFEVWGKGFNKAIDPWAGECGPNTSHSQWINNPPWMK